MAATLRAGEVVRSPAPDFDLETGTGERVRLSSYRGRSSVALFFMRAYT